MRCLTLADALRERGVEIVFVSRDFPLGGPPAIESRGYPVVRLPVEEAYRETWLGASTETELAAARAALRSLTALDAVIVDQYALDELWERAARAFASRIVVVDDLANRSHDCDILLDTTYLPPGTPDRYHDLVSAGTVRLSGPGYALLRPAFGKLPRRVRTGPMRRILVFFGAADPTGVTIRALDALEALEDVVTDVVVGCSNPRARAIEAKCAGRGGFYVDTPRMPDLMADADLSLGAAGTTSWERAWLGLPALVVSIADNQRTIAHGLEAAGAIRNLGWHEDVSAETFRRALVALRSEPQHLSAMSSASLALMGAAGRLGTERVADAVLAPRLEAASL